MRRKQVFLIVVIAVLLSACTYGSSFVIVNESGGVVQVEYRPKEWLPEKPLYFVGAPAKIAAAHLSDRKQTWQILTPEQYRLDPERRLVIVRLMPGEALRVAALADYDYDDEAQQVKRFPIEEITVVGQGGKLELVGEQARKAFTLESTGLYTVRYK